MRNFYTIEIDRKNEYIKDEFIFHLDGNFVHSKIKNIETVQQNVINGSYEYVNIKKPYDPKVKRFNNLFTYATNIYEESGVSIVRNKDGVWGILHKDGRIFNNEDLVEPIIDTTDYEIIGFTDSGLAPFYNVNGDVAFINKYSEIVAVLKLDRVNNRARLFDRNNMILKEWDFDEIYVPDECFFFGGNLVDLFEEEDFTKLLNEFLEDESGEYVFPSEIFGPSIGDEFEIDYRNTRSSDIHYGNIYIIGYVYYAKEEWERYDFIRNYVEGIFKKGYKFFKRKLVKLLGDATINGDECSVWKINKSYVILDIFNDQGDGDFGYQIRLYSYDEMD